MTARAALPVFCRVTACAGLEVVRDWLPNETLLELTAARGAVTKPVPLRLTLCGLPGAPSLMVSAPVRAPEAVGVKVTLMVQVELGARVPRQLLA